MKKILIFSLAYYPQVGGAEVAIKEITDRTQDIEWHLVTMRFGADAVREEKIGNVMVHRVGGGGSYIDKILFIPRAAHAARRLHAQHRFDGAWAMMSYMVLPIVFAKLGIPYAITLQEGDTYAHMFERWFVRPLVPVIKKGFRNARAVSALATFLAQWALRLGFTGNVEVVPQGVDTHAFALQRIPHEGTTLVTSSRLVRKNAVDDIIRALPRVPGARLVIAGVGPDEAALKRLAVEQGVADRVEFRGFIPNEQLPQLLAASDIFVRPSRSEGFGISFIEAMAAGLPVIATTEGGLADYITPDVAWPVAPNRPEQIAAQINDILGNPARAAQVVEHARRLVAERYTWDIVARAMRDKVFARLFV